MKTQDNAGRRGSVSSELAGRYVPRQFNSITRERFLRDRRRRYLARVPGGKPTDAQAALIQTLGSLEWSALLMEHEGSARSLCDARENRRLQMRLTADFEKSIATPAAPAGLSSGQALRQHLERRHRVEGTAA